MGIVSRNRQSFFRIRNLFRGSVVSHFDFTPGSKVIAKTPRGLLPLRAIISNCDTTRSSRFTARDKKQAIFGIQPELMGKKILKQFEETVKFLKKEYKHEPQVGIVLGSGLGNFAAQIEVEKEVPYEDIPHFPVSTVVGHSGKLIFGKLSGKRVVAMAGRFHFYEGYTPQEVVFPIRVMKLLGIKVLLLSNAAGSVNPDYKVGDIMIIKDHISLFTVNPLIGKNIDELGPRFPDMSEPYKRDLIKKAKEIGTEKGIELREGVYVGVTGPTFETRAEYRLIYTVGGDVVGMSTVQETIVANHMGLPVFAVSIVTDIGIREDDNIITHEEVLQAAKDAEPKLAMLFNELIASI
jgi:purine-nucleoside phosphorylase